MLTKCDLTVPLTVTKENKIIIIIFFKSVAMTSVTVVLLGVTWPTHRAARKQNQNENGETTKTRLFLVT